MRVLEDVGKALLARHGVTVPRGVVARDGAAAARAAESLGGDVVVKALVPANRRAKAGGVLFAATAEGAAAGAERLLGSTVAGFHVERVLVEQRLHLDRELYLALSLDEDRGCPVVLASAAGGVEFEAAVVADRSLVRVLELDPWGVVLPYTLRGLWAELGVVGGDLGALAALTARAAAAFFATDATLLELNPVGIREGEAIALGALLAVDDQALFRHADLASEASAVTHDGWRSATPLELEAAKIAAAEPYRGTARFIELDGDIGLLVGGGGGSLVFFDGVRRAGGRPACYTEVGGNPSAEKVRGLTRVVLRCPGIRGLLVGHNITNNTQVDLVAKGVVAALDDLGVDPHAFPVVAREVGTNDVEGRSIFEAAGIEYLGPEHTMDAAARRIVERVAEAA